MRTIMLLVLLCCFSARSLAARDAQTTPESAKQTVDLQEPTVEPLDAVLTLLHTGTATSHEKDRLVGRTYTGIITVADVKNEGSDNKPNVVIVVDAKTDDYRYTGYFSFADAEGARLDKLKKGDKVKVTARLKRVRRRSSGYINVGSTEWCEFIETKIAEVPQESQ